MAITLLEQTLDLSPSKAGWSLEGGRAVATYLVSGPDATDLQGAATSILGGVVDPGTPSGNGNVVRVPPLAHPLYSWMFADSISQVQGVGGEFSVESASTELEVPAVPQYVLNQQYWFTVEFRGRPYPVFQDFDLSYVSDTYYDEFGNSAVTWTGPNEWERFTDWDMTKDPGAFITSQQGQMAFQAPGNACVNNKTFVATPKMFLPDLTLKFRWHGVPRRYITSTNSYVTRWIGRVNQNAWYLWNAGQLLYRGFTPRTYTPPVQQESLWAPGIFSVDKLVDIEFEFGLTYRTINPLDLPSMPSNLNFVQAGWNLQPWLTDRQFHYCISTPIGQAYCTTPVGYPSFLSAPFSTLFLDPDASGSPTFPSM